MQLLVIILIIIKFFIQTVSTVQWQSNEVNLLESYLKLSNETVNITTILDGCIESLSPNQYYPCSGRNLKLTDDSCLWRPTITPPDCSYTVDQNINIQRRHDIDIISFKMIQSECKTLLQIQGGSTFEITCKTPWAIAAGHVIDHENNTYEITCIFSTMSKHRFRPLSEEVRALNF